MSYNSKKVADLRKELEALGLPIEGTKPMLIKRLTDANAKDNKRKEPESPEKDEEVPAKRARKATAKKAEEDEKPKKPAAKGRGRPKKNADDDEKEEEKKGDKEEKEDEKKDEGDKKETQKQDDKEKKEKKEDQAEDEEKEAEKEEKAKEIEDTKGAAKEANKQEGDNEWKWKGTLMYWETPDVKHSDKLAMFDYDGCLANTSLFKKGPDAWSLLFPNVPDKLKELHDKGYKLVIMTNQSDIGKMAKEDTRKKAIAEKVGRLTGFVNKVGLPFQVLVATAKNKSNDEYRKPAKGMWDHLLANNGGITPDMPKCFFVGDAAGRKKDHSDSDKEFAKNAGLTFYTEDVFFKTGVQI